MPLPSDISTTVVPHIASLWVTKHGPEVLFRCVVSEWTLKQTIATVLTGQGVTRRGNTGQKFLEEVERLLGLILKDMGASDPPEETALSKAVRSLMDGDKVTFTSGPSS